MRRGYSDAVALRGRGWFVDDERSIGAWARTRRWQQLLAVYRDLADMRVLDLGGTAEAWRRAPVRPCFVHVVNIAPDPEDVPDWMVVEQGDACSLADHVLAAPFDLVYSNSAIEHVGGHAQRMAFAAQVTRLAAPHWIQTPYRYFPIEPHWVAPGMQYLPVRWRAHYARHWPIGFSYGKPIDEVTAEQASIELLGIRAMREYFPADELVYERLGPVVKSLIAVSPSR